MLSKADRTLLLKAAEAEVHQKSLASLAKKKRVPASDLEQRVRAAVGNLNRAVQRLSEDNGGDAAAITNPEGWNSRKNRRRLELIRKETYEQLTPEEGRELTLLQEEMFAAREIVAPIPVASVERFYHQLMQQQQVAGEAG